MLAEKIARLEELLLTIPNLLYTININDFEAKPNANKWSKKEILGHLIDSATNNHQRFVRGQFEESPAIAYDQNNWNTFSFHQEIEKDQLINFWTIYNKQILEIVKRISETNLTRTVNVKGNLLTLEFLIMDYVEHLEHHLRQIVNY